jgi:hypothetical protein
VSAGDRRSRRTVCRTMGVSSSAEYRESRRSLHPTLVFPETTLR